MIRRLVLLLLLVAPLFAQGRTAAEEIGAGRRLFDEGKLDEAETHFRRARMLVPRAWQGHAYHAMTLIQQATREKDPARREGLLREAGKVSASLIKKSGAGLRFTDPLYRFLQAVIKSVRGEHLAAHAKLRELMRLPPAQFKPYAEVPLRPNIEQAYAQASLIMVNRLIVLGAFQDSDELLDEVGKLIGPKSRLRLDYERQAAVVDEHLGRVDNAIDHIKAAIELAPGKPNTQQELRATIAMLLIQNKRLDEGRAMLDELPKDSRIPEVMNARCMLRYELARRDPRGEAMRDAIAMYRSALANVPTDEAYLLTEQFTDLVLSKVDRRTAKGERALLEAAVEAAKKQIELRPECPRMYYALYRLYRLLGDAEQEVRYQVLHEKKKAEWGTKEQYDERGRPRCR